MIIGIAALISMLFGSVNEIFFVEKIEKGVKEYVIEKEMQKDILADLKSTKKYTEKFYKQRNKQFGTFKKMYKLQNSSEKDFYAFYEELDKQRQEMQDKVIDDRISTLNKIKADEWDSILQYSGSSIDKRKEKELKKAEKKGNVVPFAKTRKVITEVVSAESQQKSLLDGLDMLIATFEKFGQKILSINVKENDTLIQKDATKTMLKNTQKEMNNERQKCFDELVVFHGLVKKTCDSAQWDSIMKAFTKELEVSAR